MNKGKLVILLAVIVLAAAGIFALVHKTKPAATPASSSNSSSSAATTTPSSQVTTPQVTIANMMFTPAQITIQKGLAVTWTNNDSVAHTVTADKGTGPDSGSIAPGKTYTYTFNTAGSFQYHCTFHSQMHGTVVVQ